MFVLRPDMFINSFYSREYSIVLMGVDHGGTEDPQNLEWGILPQILSCCKILSTRLLALQCRQMCFVCLYSRTLSPAMRHPPPRIPVRSTPMIVLATIKCNLAFYITIPPSRQLVPGAAASYLKSSCCWLQRCCCCCWRCSCWQSCVMRGRYYATELPLLSHLQHTSNCPSQIICVIGRQYNTQSF